jgi:hypothetical protein
MDMTSQTLSSAPTEGLDSLNHEANEAYPFDAEQEVGLLIQDLLKDLESAPEEMDKVEGKDSEIRRWSPANLEEFQMILRAIIEARQAFDKGDYVEALWLIWFGRSSCPRVEV